MSKRCGYGILSALVAALLAPHAYADEQQPATPATPAPASAPAAPAESSVPAEQADRKPILERYNDGIVIWQTPDDVQVPFMLKFNLNTEQQRDLVEYLKSL